MEFEEKFPSLRDKEHVQRMGEPPTFVTFFLKEDVEAHLIDKARTRIILNAFFPKIRVSYSYWKELFEELGLKEEAE